MLATQPAVNPVISIMGANVFIIGGRIPVLLGLVTFWNQEKSRLPLLCCGISVIALIAIFYFTFVNDSPLWRIRVFSTTVLITSLCILYILTNGLKIERQLRPAMSIGTNYGVKMLLALFAIQACVDAFSIFGRSGVPIWEPDPATYFYLLNALVFILLFTLGIVLMTMDEMSLEQKEDAIYDPITTILNHRTFLEVGQRVLGVALRYSKPVSLLTIEVSNLDEVVQQFGVKVGNEMLRHFALMATDRRRNEDVLARSSYKEFRMLLPGVDEEGADVVVEKINQALQAEHYVYRGKTFKVAVYIATVTKREEDLHLQQMLQEGEVELYRIKQKALQNDANTTDENAESNHEV